MSKHSLVTRPSRERVCFRYETIYSHNCDQLMVNSLSQRTNNWSSEMQSVVKMQCEMKCNCDLVGSKANNPEFVKQSKGQAKVLTHGDSCDCRVNGNGTPPGITLLQTYTSSAISVSGFKKDHILGSINLANYAQLHSDHRFSGFLASVFITSCTNTQWEGLDKRLLKSSSSLLWECCFLGFFDLRTSPSLSHPSG